jgi:hypothetical protein
MDEPTPADLMRELVEIRDLLSRLVSPEPAIPQHEIDLVTGTSLRERMDAAKQKRLSRRSRNGTERKNASGR